MNVLHDMPATADFPVFGTTAQLLVTVPGALAGALRRLRRELAAIDAACSRFRSDSELSRAQSGHGRAVVVSPLLGGALDAAWHAARISHGLVDPTVGQAVRRLGYDRSFAALRPEELGGIGPVVPAAAPGIGVVAWDPAERSLRVPPEVRLDLGATAKAWAADRCAGALADAMGCGVLVNLGGDLAAAGPAPAGGWRVALSDDHRRPTPGAPTVAVRSGALATSGVAVRAWNRSGRRMHHIVDPRTGDNPAPCWRTVSVAAASCVDANTAATAAVVLGHDALGMLGQVGLPARLVALDGTVHTVGGWPADDAGAAGTDGVKGGVS
ncbi:FAD:protein FMN transferase [Streptacidiphilus rugosus]|uniref:FAD:protein FMN transferase n=1 Tax=Streptacidiphilus rugosus TaxID=405783 RepID=UPI000B2DEFE7|nr:FAD:protein FMN transferase [Streptacidiphilus rugosus]